MKLTSSIVPLRSAIHVLVLVRGGRPSHRRRPWAHRASLGPCRRPRQARPHRRAGRVVQHLAVEWRARDPAAAVAARRRLQEADVVGEYQRALAAGDVEAAVTTGTTLVPAA